MKIECPHCNSDNDIEFSDNILCHECKKSFKGFKFSKRKFLSATTVLIIGAFGGYKVNGALEQERYPLEIEYAIVDTCVNVSKNFITIGRYTDKRKICLCALSKTIEDVSYSDFKSKNSKFATSFKQHADSCS
ncbi:hypothetical protein B7R74_19960 [Yersinia pseudotuberculosis]|uniref:Uncharacterized protein n=1 Tax=Yersinia pseudotuberculosis TaxID=633 RepID=A0A380QD74_YERPU|nr:hypothetical protein [Yersinia pseudotuberculosis]PSH12760.1 hypothetical protein B7R74_19960 [Yersinia pseudotuberculosis]SUP85051.1 Uncharacterised protein [Yersinia pseudotuberculosis]